MIFTEPGKQMGPTLHLAWYFFAKGYTTTANQVIT
jgi:hypothetical protein